MRIVVLGLGTPFLMAISLGLIGEGFADERRPLSAPSSVEVVQLTPSNGNALSLALSEPEGPLRDVLRDAGNAQISRAQVDLAGNGNPATITQLIGTDTCGARDCETVITTELADKEKIIFDENASNIAIGPRDKSGWHQLITNFVLDQSKNGSGVLWGWNSERERYEIQPK
jgi:hypothetical protein